MVNQTRRGFIKTMGVALGAVPGAKLIASEPQRQFPDVPEGKTRVDKELFNTVKFYGADGKEIGRIEWKDGIVRIKGNYDESAKQFTQAIADHMYLD